MKIPVVRLNRGRLDKMADISIGVANILFASFVIPFLVPSLDTPPFSVLLLGIGFSVGFWTFAIKIIEK